jgi:hypothetical protein
MEILITKKAKEQLQGITEKELLELRDDIKKVGYTGVSKGKLDDGRFFTIDFYKSKDRKCIISEFFIHYHENDAYNSYLDFILARTDEDGNWLI